MFLDPDGDERTYGLKPMNCPGHMLLFGSRCASYRELPMRYAEAAPLHRNELAGALHGLTRVRHVTQDDAHIFCTEDQIEDEIDGCLDYVRVPLRPLRARAARRALDAAREQARQRRGVGLHRGRRCSAALERHGIEFAIGEGEGVFYGPKIDLHMTDVARPLVADGDDPARLRSMPAAVRAHVHGRGQPRASRRRHPPRAASARSSASSAS